MALPPAGGPLAPGLLDAVAPHGVENFVTNAFAWLLSNIPGLGVGFLDFLRRGATDPCHIPQLDEDSLRWDTQTPFYRQGKAPLRPDMTCSDGKHGVVFEHKTWTSPSCGQLAGYRKHAPERFHGSPIVLITAHRGQHEQNPDLALCWSDVHDFLDNWTCDGDARFAVLEFQTLLTTRGLGPMNKLGTEDVRNFRPIERILRDFLASVAQRKWCDGAELKVRSRWGRLGFMVRGKGTKSGSWDPGVFVGVLLDGWDHCTRPSDREGGPDACVIVSVHQDLHAKGGEPPKSKLLAEKLEKEMNASPLRKGEWEIYRHAAQDKERDKKPWGPHPHGVNPWHPLHIRRPLAEVLGDADTVKQQVEQFYCETHAIAELVLKNIEAPWKR